ncbi:MAG: ATP-binding protein [Saprospiraceae bacterium]
MSIVVNEKRLVMVERAFVFFGIFIAFGISLEVDSVLCLSYYILPVLFLGFVEGNPAWRKFLLGFITIFFLVSYELMDDEFMSAGGGLVLLIGTIDSVVVCVVLILMVVYFARTNYFVFDLAGTVSKQAEERLVKAKNIHEKLQIQQVNYLVAQERDSRAVELHRKRRSVLSARQEELEQFAYAASHDLKEPVRTIKSFIQIVRKRLPKELEAELDLGEYFELVATNSGAMDRLLESLLDYSRAIGLSIRPEPLHLGLRLQKILEQHSGVTTQLTADSGQVVFVDPIVLEKVIEIIVSNAKKFSTEGLDPVLHIEVLENVELNYTKAETYNESDQRRNNEAGDPQSCIQLQFSDNGIGISEEYHQRVFQLFQRLHKREEYVGAGIGLTLARRLLEKSNGSIWIETAQDGGTCVCVELPSYPLDLPILQ